MKPVVLETRCPNLRLRNRGKVRDLYDLDDQLLIVATDRISAFDYVLPNGIPDKGRVLTALSEFWFRFTEDIVPNHLISVNLNDFPPEALPYRDQLEGRTMIVRTAERIDIECVVRGYLSGSAWKEYRENGTVCGEALPSGLRESDRLPKPLFTPAIKADTGHDENVSIRKMAELVGVSMTARLLDLSIAVYEVAATYAAGRGILIADTKFEFGTHHGKIILIDEVLTPDSSRFWLASDYQPGRPQKSFDKQPVRDYLESLGWDKQPPVPSLSDEVVAGTNARYQEAYKRLIGQSLDVPEF